MRPGEVRAGWLLAGIVAAGYGCGRGGPGKGLVQTPPLAAARAAGPAGEPAPGGGDAGDASGSAATWDVPGGRLRVQFCTDDIVRVAFAPDPAFFERATLATAPKRCPGATVRREADGAGLATLSSPRLSVRVAPSTGSVTFLDPAGRTILAERTPAGRSLVAASVDGDSTHHVRQEWTPDRDESLYGLGQHQNGLFDIRGTDLDLYQHNTEVFIPFLVSSKGYGILWDNTSFTRFGDLTDPVPLPGTVGLYAAEGLPGDVDPRSGEVDWSGTVIPTVSGDYTLRTYSNGSLQVRVNGALVVDHFRQDWLPGEDIAHLTLAAGAPARVAVSFRGQGSKKLVRVLWKPPVADRSTSLWSESGDGVDYWFVYGPELSRVVAGYRRLTGEAPLMPRWAFGLWQSKERYQTSDEVLAVVRGYRDRGVPLDNVVQDWRYWPEETWGSHEFDPVRYPDPSAWIRTLHEELHAQLMISAWPKFYPGTANFEALRAAGFLYPRNLVEAERDFLGHEFTFYDAFRSDARRLYWSQLDRALFSRGVDAFWLDASEPEVVEGPFESAAAQRAEERGHMSPTALGPGSRVLNAYPLVHSQAVYEGQRGEHADQRVFILTRSAFAGQQRYAAATWSGDITATWTALRKQVPAGLGFSLSGVPYWTFDSGGFAVPGRFSARSPTPADSAEWAELQARWFEYATFVPITRLHGQAPSRELWSFGGENGPAYAAMVKFDRLRYRLLPYIYSLAGAVTRDGDTFLRPLVMDFPLDPRARGVGDQYLFGPALLVSPVTAYKARTRRVYLPPAAAWYDFWTGRALAGGQSIVADAPYDAIPLHVRAGSIVPIGPDLQYASEKAADPIILYVYAGADGAFTLYEDQGTTYGYERGEFATIALRWVDARRTISLGAREGSFPGMLTERTFRVVVVDRARPAGVSSSPSSFLGVTYRGQALDLVVP